MLDDIVSPAADQPESWAGGQPPCNSLGLCLTSSVSNFCFQELLASGLLSPCLSKVRCGYEEIGSTFVHKFGLVEGTLLLQLSCPCRQ
eukprot:467650-Pelagomonas_calceolata.AAC.1